jgi:hypothetical protein
VRAAIAASNFGPKQPRGTATGSSARTVQPQSGHQTCWSRCSLISTASGGNSATWRRAGIPLGSLIPAEDVTATTAPRPALRDLCHPLDKNQHAPVPDMTGLAALLAPRPPRPAPLPQQRRIMTRRQPRVGRVPFRPLLELLDPLRQRHQLRILYLRPGSQSEQRIDHRLAPLRVDRLRLDNRGGRGSLDRRASLRSARHG